MWKHNHIYPPSTITHKYATTHRPKKFNKKQTLRTHTHTHKCKSWAGLWAFNDQSSNYGTFPLSETEKEKDKVCVSRRLVTRQENSVLECVKWIPRRHRQRTPSFSLALFLKKDKVKTLHTNKATIPGIVKMWLNHKKKHISEKHNQRATAHTADVPHLPEASGNWVFAAPLSSQTARKSDLLTIAWRKAGFDISVTGLIFKYLASIWLFFQPVLTFVSGDTITSSRPRPIAVRTCY